MFASWCGWALNTIKFHQTTHRGCSNGIRVNCMNGICTLPKKIESILYTSSAARGGAGSFKRQSEYKSEEHVRIELFVTTLIDWTFFLMTRKKLAFVGFVAARNCMRQQVLDDAKSLPNCVSSQSATTWTLPTYSAQYYSVLQSTEQYYSALQSTTPVLPCTTKYHYYYKVRLQNYKVLLRTTKHCYCTALFYKVLLQGVLLQDYSVLQSIAPPCYKVLLCSTKYVSSTTTYYSVLQRTTPVLIHSCSVLLLQYYSVLQSTTAVLQRIVPVLATPVLLCTTMYYSSTTKYYYVLKSLTWHVTDIARSNTGVIVQPHQILCLPLPRKMSLMIDYCHISKVIYNAPSSRCHPPTSPNIAPVSKSDSHDASSTHMRPYLQCAEQQVSPSNLTKYCACHAKWLACLILVTYETPITKRGATGDTLQCHQILCLPWKMPTQNLTQICWKQVRHLLQCAAVSRQPATQPRLLFMLATRICLWKIQHFALRLSFRISPSTAPATKRDSETSPNTAPATKSDTWTWPSTAPATKTSTSTPPSTAPATKSVTWTSPNIAPAS